MVNVSVAFSDTVLSHQQAEGICLGLCVGAWVCVTEVDEFWHSDGFYHTRAADWEQLN